MRVFDLHVFGRARRRKIINIKKIVPFMMRNSIGPIHDFRARSSESRCCMGILFSFYMILGLHGAFRNVTLRISEKALYFLYFCR